MALWGPQMAAAGQGWTMGAAVQYVCGAQGPKGGLCGPCAEAARAPMRGETDAPDPSP